MDYKKIIKKILEINFEDFELGDSIQILDKYIYIEVEIKGKDVKLRFPFSLIVFEASVKLSGFEYTMTKLERDIYIMLLKMI